MNFWYGRFENDVRIQVFPFGSRTVYVYTYRMCASAKAEVWCAWTWLTYFIYWQIHGWKTFLLFLPRAFFALVLLQLFGFLICNSLCSVLFTISLSFSRLHSPHLHFTIKCTTQNTVQLRGVETCITSIFCTAPCIQIYTTHSQQQYERESEKNGILYWLLNASMNDYAEVKMTYQSFNVQTFAKKSPFVGASIVTR